MNEKTQKHEFQAVIVSVVSHNADTGSCIIRVKPTTKDGIELIKSSTSGKQFISVLGTYFNPVEGGYVTCSGSFKDDPKWGVQFRASSILITSVLKKNFESDGVMSRLFSQASPEIKAAIIEKYPEHPFNAILTDQLSIDGLVSKDVNDKLRADLKRFEAVFETYAYLRGLGISIDAADSIVECFGNYSKDIVSSDPYRLLTVDGVGFANIDAAANTMRLGMTSSRRIGYGFSYIINHYLSQGHSGYYFDYMVEKISKTMKLEHGFVTRKLSDMSNQGGLVVLQRGARKFIVDFTAYRTEQEVAKNVVRIAGNKNGKKITSISVDQGFYNEGQIKAVRNTLSNKFAIITGGPGFGKTTVLEEVIRVIELCSHDGNEILMAAPTGQAADRMSNATGRPAKTIHDLLEYIPGVGFNRNEDNRLVCDTVVVDELSMADINIFLALLKAIPSEARVILLGDVDQLASIGPGAVLKDLIASRRICVSKLTEPTRYGASSDIFLNATLVNKGQLPDLSYKQDSNFRWTECKTEKSIFDSIIDRVKKLNYEDGIPYEDIQVLTPRRETLVGTNELNKKLRDLINPRVESNKFGFISYGTSFRIGDRVLVTKNDNDLDVKNGQIGHIKFIDFKSRNVSIEFGKDGERKSVPFSFFSKIKLAYAITIHKAQGSEARGVVLVVSESHAAMLNVQLLYTGMTRAKERLEMIGSTSALSKAIVNNGREIRNTVLSEMIELEFNKFHSYNCSSMSG